MEIFRVTFIGHREQNNISCIEDEIEKKARELLYRHEYIEFYVGRNGDFDISAASAIRRVQKAYGKERCSLILVLPYSVKNEIYYEKYYDEILFPLNSNTHHKQAITKRNEWLIDNSNLLICYVEENRRGGALTVLKKARKGGIEIINLATRDYKKTDFCD